LDAALADARRTMDDYFGAHAAWEGTRKRSKDSEPTLPDLAEMFEDRGLTLHDTPLVDRLDLIEYDIGRAVDRNTGAPFAFTAFREADRLYAYQARQFPPPRTDTLAGATGDVPYLYWKIEDDNARVPELDEVKDKVIQAWKFARAYEKAMQEAEQFAQQARDGGTTLKGAFGTAKQVIETAGTSYYDRSAYYGSLLMMRENPRMPPRVVLGRINGVEGAGPSFMKTLFDLELYEVGVIPTDWHETICVARVKAVSPSDKQLRDGFHDGVVRNVSPGMPVSLPLEVRAVAMRSQQEYAGMQFEDLYEELEVEWRREALPDTRTDR